MATVTAHAIEVERESIEFITLTVCRDGEVVDTLNMKYALVKSDKVRPTVWLNCEVLDGKTGFYTGGLEPGVWTVWWKATDGTETPVGVVPEQLKVR